MTTPDSLAESRRADSDRRRQRVLRALDRLTQEGAEISVSAVARAAGVHRSFVYRHRDLHSQILTRAERAPDLPSSPAVSQRSLKADLANLTERNARLTGHITRLENRLSEVMGEQVWRESGLGAPTDIDVLNRRITELEQQVIGFKRQLSERDDELEAAREANRELMALVNRHA